MSLIPRRKELIKLEGIYSSYFGKTSGNRLDVKYFGDAAYITTDLYVALKKLDQLVKNENGTLYITDLLRDWKMQSDARKEYESGKKKAFVSLPGSSFHGSGRAVDIDIQNLNFKNTKKQNWLKKLWELTSKVGLRPIITSPNMNASEAWHFDMMSEWKECYKNMGYAETAKACILDSGQWNPKENIDKIQHMFIQAQLLRLGMFETGKIDGIIGKKTKHSLKVLGLEKQSVPELIETLKYF